MTSIHLVNKITSAIDRKEITCVFLDLSEAFDTIDHDILFVSWSTTVSMA